MCRIFILYIYIYIYMYKLSEGSLVWVLSMMTAVIWDVVEIKRTPVWRLPLLKEWRTFRGMLSVFSMLKSTQICLERILNRRTDPMPENSSFICKELQGSFAVVWTEGLCLPFFFSLTLTCLLKRYSICEFNSKFNVLCVETVDVCMCKFWNLCNKKIKENSSKKSSIWHKSIVCCLCVL